MIQYLIESSLIWLILYGFYHLLLRRETFFRLNRFYLIMALLAGLLMPLISIPLESSSGILSFYLDPVNSVANSNPVLSTISQSETFFTFHPSMLLWALYFIGSGIFFRKLILNYHSILALYQNGSKSNKRDHVLIITDEKLNPFSFFNWMFIPKSSLKSNDFGVISSHELAHIRQKHSIDILFLEILKSLFWFNPIINIYKKAMVENHEFLADQTSLQDTEKYNYGHLLLSFIPTKSDLYLGNQLHNSIIKNRITMMYKENSQTKNLYKYLFLFPLLSLLFFIVSCDNKEEIATKPEETKVEYSSEYSETLDDEVFKVVEQMPRFPGCEHTEGSDDEKFKCANTELIQYIFSNLKYPEEARKGGIEGNVVAQFVVDEKGTIQDAKIVKDIGYGCGEEVLKIVNSMNEMDEKWTPGKQNGEKVKVMFTLPVKFKLEDKTEE